MAATNPSCATSTSEARKPVIATNVDATVCGIRLRRLFPTFNLSKTSVGQFGGRAKFVTTGNSFADMAAADGNIGLAMNGGATSELLLALAQIHGDQALMYPLGDDEKARIRCAEADFKVKDGVMRTDSFLIDTTATNHREQACFQDSCRSLQERACRRSTARPVASAAVQGIIRHSGAGVG